MKHLVHEHQTIEINDSNIYKDYEKYQKSSINSAIGNLENRNIYFKDTAHLVNAGNNVGILEFNNNSIEFRPKMDCNGENDNFWQFLPRMLHILSDYDQFSSKVFIDPKQLVKLPKGASMVPLLAVSLASLCSRAIEKGFYKKYTQKTDRLKKIKGKINFAELSRNKPWDLSTVPCTYYELTFNNPENQIILWCIHKLLRETQKIINQSSRNNSTYILNKLREQYTLLSEEISLMPKTYKDILNINNQGLPAHYVDLMNVCRAILSNSLFSFDNSNNSTNYGVNFIIDMDWVFEQYMTSLFKETVREDIDLAMNIDIKDQEKQTLCDQNKIKIKPDLIIYKKENANIPVAIIDFKWKFAEKNVNADFYQVICYGMAELQKHNLSTIDVGLFAVDNKSDSKNIQEEHFDEISKIFEPNEKSIVIRKYSIPSVMLNQQETNILDVENNIKNNIKEFLNKYL